MNTARTTALVADDEPLLRESLISLLVQAWPALDVIGQARNGREAVELYESQQPDVCFLDVQMPGLSGIDAAQQIGAGAQIVFVTAFHHYAVEAFAQGVLDYLVKPVSAERLAQTVERVQARLERAEPAPQDSELLLRVLQQMKPLRSQRPLRWIRASIGQTLRLIGVDDVDYLRAGDKYTVVAFRGDGGRASEALIRLSLKELLAQLDPALFVQVHRSAVVNLRAVDYLVRESPDTGALHIKGRPDVLPVSRQYLAQFRQM